MLAFCIASFYLYVIFILAATDLQVENELHNFIADGIVSHNTLLEDSMMAYRVTRSAERRVFYIDVGNIAPQDIEQYMEKVITQMKRHQITSLSMENNVI